MTEEECLNTIHTLCETVWDEAHLDGAAVDDWLKGFGSAAGPNTTGRLHALYLLSRFIYFGASEVRALAQALFRDHFRYQIVAQERRLRQDTRNELTLSTAFDRELRNTRFVAIGGPSESGTHILYFYRQQNELASDLFIDFKDIFDIGAKSPTLREPSVSRYLFLDDFCGSGKQATAFSNKSMYDLKAAATASGVSVRAEYHVLVAAKRGLKAVRDLNTFDSVECVLELDESFRAFSTGSRYFVNAPAGIDRRCGEQLASSFGFDLQPDAPLGFEDGQLMLGFTHNTPDNTLPIFWHAGSSVRNWRPVFPRHAKS